MLKYYGECAVGYVVHTKNLLLAASFLGLLAASFLGLLVASYSKSLAASYYIAFTSCERALSTWFYGLEKFYGGGGGSSAYQI